MWLHVHTPASTGSILYAFAWFGVLGFKVLNLRPKEKKKTRRWHWQFEILEVFQIHGDKRSMFNSQETLNKSS